jgi:hypothetical protein
MKFEKCEDYYTSNYEWIEVEFLIGKFMGGFHYSAKPVKRYTVMFRWDDLNYLSTCSGLGSPMGYYDTIRAAEQAINSFEYGRYTIVDELTKHTSHYMGEKK